MNKVLNIFRSCLLPFKGRLGGVLLLLLVATPMMAADFDLGQGLNDFINEMGFVTFFVQEEGWKNAVMILIGCFLLWLAIKK